MGGHEIACGLSMSIWEPMTNDDFPCHLDVNFTSRSREDMINFEFYKNSRFFELFHRSRRVLFCVINISRVKDLKLKDPRSKDQRIMDDDHGLELLIKKCD